LSGAEVGKVRGELAGYDRFAALSQRIVEVNEAICEARPVLPVAESSPGSGDEKGGPATNLGPISPPDSKRRSPPK